jgi:hypothetical protein
MKQMGNLHKQSQGESQGNKEVFRRDVARLEDGMAKGGGGCQLREKEKEKEKATYKTGT